MTTNRYDKSNIFAKMLRNEIPRSEIYENEYALAFHDLYPCAPIHMLVIPKGEFRSFGDFIANASGDQIVGFWQVVADIIKKHDLEKNGYRIVTNCGDDGMQTVDHFHIHIIAGRTLGRMISEHRP